MTEADELELSQRNVSILHVSLQVFKAATVQIVVFWVVLHDWACSAGQCGGDTEPV